MEIVRLPGFTAECAVSKGGAEFNASASFSGAIGDIRPQRGMFDLCSSLGRKLQHYYYLYGLDVASGDQASAAANLQKIDDLQRLLAFC